MRIDWSIWAVGIRLPKAFDALLCLQLVQMYTSEFEFVYVLETG